MNQAPLMLSVSGLRGLVGQSLTPVEACRYGAAVGSWFLRQTGKSPHLVVGRDSRPSGQMIEFAVCSGLLAVGCSVTTIGIASTPGVAVMAKHLQADGGVVVTASHNPIQWNGIKVLRQDGTAPSADQAAEIIKLFNEDDVAYLSPESMCTTKHDDSVVSVHCDAILKHIDVGLIREASLKIVLDSVHGAGGPETRAMLDLLNVQVVHLWAEPTGQFPHTPEPTRENLVGLCAAVREHKADIGFAQDPDADRLAIVDEAGRYIGEEYTLALAGLHLLKKNDIAVTNLSTSRMLDDVAKLVGATVLRSPVGEANVAQLMQKNQATIGGEGNGGVMLPSVSYVRDSLVGIALTLEMMATRGQSLSLLVQQIPTYAIVKKKYSVSEYVLLHFVSMMLEKFAGQSIDQQDGLRVEWPDAWVHVRPSNTEPVLRIIAEADSDAKASELIEQVATLLSLKSH